MARELAPEAGVINWSGDSSQPESVLPGKRMVGEGGALREHGGRSFLNEVAFKLVSFIQSSIHQIILQRVLLCQALPRLLGIQKTQPLPSRNLQLVETDIK